MSPLLQTALGIVGVLLVVAVLAEVACYLHFGDHIWEHLPVWVKRPKPPKRAAPDPARHDRQGPRTGSPYDTGWFNTKTGRSKPDNPNPPDRRTGGAR